jgi:hypothetical protein
MLRFKEIKTFIKLFAALMQKFQYASYVNEVQIPFSFSDTSDLKIKLRKKFVACLHHSVSLAFLLPKAI